jgi:hypothetical protein
MFGPLHTYMLSVGVCLVWTSAHVSHLFCVFVEERLLSDTLLKFLFHFLNNADLYIEVRDTCNY